MTFFFKFFFKNVNSNKNLMSDSQTIYPCSSMSAVDACLSESTLMYSGPLRSEIRARSVTLVGLGSREEHGLAVLCCVNRHQSSEFPLRTASPHTFRQQLDDLLHFLLETDFQNSICLVDDQSLQVLEDESLGILQWIKIVQWPKLTAQHYANIPAGDPANGPVSPRSS